MTNSAQPWGGGPAREVPVELLPLLVSHDAMSGKLYWRARTFDLFNGDADQRRRACATWNSRFAGKEAFAVKLRGYARGTILGVDILAHRLIWALHHGEWPGSEIDHINGDRADNRLENLRCVSRRENALNQRRPANSSSGVTGVNRWNGKWRAYITSKGKWRHLGSFPSREMAIAARRKAEQELGFHENHGREVV